MQKLPKYLKELTQLLFDDFLFHFILLCSVRACSTAALNSGQLQRPPVRIAKKKAFAVCRAPYNVLLYFMLARPKAHKAGKALIVHSRNLYKPWNNHKRKTYHQFPHAQQRLDKRGGGSFSMQLTWVSPVSTRIPAIVTNTASRSLQDQGYFVSFPNWLESGCHLQFQEQAGWGTRLDYLGMGTKVHYTRFYCSYMISGLRSFTTG